MPAASSVQVLFPKPCGVLNSLALPPSALIRLRASTAAASGIVTAGRCATTAIAIAYGQDPAEDVVSRIVKSLVATVHALSEDLPELRVAWRNAFAKVVWGVTPQYAGNIRWQCVTGPLAAAIATLTMWGWRVSFLEHWVSPDGRWITLNWKPVCV